MKLKEKLLVGGCDAALAALYGEDKIREARDRYAGLIDRFIQRFGEREGMRLCCAPGRTELSGNHTDHNHGRVLAASVDLDIAAVAAPTEDGSVCECSEGFAPVELNVEDLSYRPEEEGTSAALIRGVAARLKEQGCRVGGFLACSASRVPGGSGLSSSAAYEVLVGTLFNVLYNGGQIRPTQLALASQYAENVYFGKPSGLMDQMACATGGAVAIDFKDPAAPLVRPIPLDFSKWGLALCIVNTGGSHADLTPDYAAVPAEMKAVAKEMGVGFLRDTDAPSVLARASALRNVCGDRALLRAFHFFAEDKRAAEMAAALEKEDIDTYLRLMRESGASSFQFLQNLYSNKDVTCQGLSLAICVAQQVLGGEGAARVHGGGFAGTTQNLVPFAKLPAFEEAMEAVFGPGCCHVLRIRPVGGVCLEDM